MNAYVEMITSDCNNKLWKKGDTGFIMAYLMDSKDNINMVVVLHSAAPKFIQCKLTDVLYVNVKLM